MERINLSVERSFSEVITATFNFLKQEIKPFLAGFAVLVLPIIVLFVLAFNGVLTSSLFLSEEEMMANPALIASMYSNLMYVGLLSGVLSLWSELFVLAYLRVYRNHYLAGNQEMITLKEVWRMMLDKLLMFWGWSSIFGFIIFVGLMFCVIPGIYFGIALIFGTYYVMLKDVAVGDAFSASRKLIKGNWWMTFGLVVVLGLLIAVVSFIFELPSFILGVGTGISGELPNTYLLIAVVLFAYIGKFLLNMVLYLGLGMQFFSLQEREEHTTLLGKIENMG